jgi:hypothetical protein
MTFHNKGFHVVRNLISKDEATIINKHLYKKNIEILDDAQLSNTPSFYRDKLSQELQIKLLPKIEKHTDLKLFKTYTYARIYKNGDILRIHKDREACEISLTLDLGGDAWDIWVLDRDENPIKVKLNIGDALIYRGCDIWHWRGKFKGDTHPQLFIHYIDKHGPYTWAKDDLFRQNPLNNT